MNLKADAVRLRLPPIILLDAALKIVYVRQSVDLSQYFVMIFNLLLTKQCLNGETRVVGLCEDHTYIFVVAYSFYRVLAIFKPSISAYAYPFFDKVC